MGYDKGFDLFPPLKGEEDLEKWQFFLSIVESKFIDDPNIRLSDDCIHFHVVEGPTLLRNGIYFRRFSSKFFGSYGDAEGYITAVSFLAQYVFKERIHPWNDLFEVDPIYSWNDVHDNEELDKDSRLALKSSNHSSSDPVVRFVTNTDIPLGNGNKKGQWIGKSSREEEYYSSDEEFDNEQTESYWNAALKFMDEILPLKDFIIERFSMNSLSLQQRKNVLESTQLDRVMMDLEKRPSSRFYDSESFYGMKGFDIFQDAIIMSWLIFPEYSLGLHMLIDYLAEKTHESDLKKMTTEMMETLKSIAVAKTSNPLFDQMVSANTSVILHRLGKSAIGLPGQLARSSKEFNALTKMYPFGTEEFEEELAQLLGKQMMDNMLMSTLKDKDKNRQSCANPGCSTVRVRISQCTGEEEVKLLRCGGCHKVCYCDKVCQKSHWKKGHKEICKSQI